MKIIFLALILFQFHLYAGTESGGGGGVIEIEGKVTLIDFFQLKNFVEPIFQIKIHNSFQLAEDITGQWAKLPYDLVSYLVQASVSQNAIRPWLFTKITLPYFEHYRPKHLDNSSEIKTAAYYSIENGKYQVQANLSIWKRMNQFNQTALIIHEALRNVQLGIKTNFNEETLQQATVIYMTCQPDSRLNYYLNYILRNDLSSAQQIYGNFESILENNCKGIE